MQCSLYKALFTLSIVLLHTEINKNHPKTTNKSLPSSKHCKCSHSKELPRKQLLCLLSKMAFSFICPSVDLSDCVCVSVKLSVCVRQEVVNHLESSRNAVSSQAALQGVVIFPFSKHHPILQQTGPSTFCSGWPKTHRHTCTFLMYRACGRHGL